MVGVTCTYTQQHRHHSALVVVVKALFHDGDHVNGPSITSTLTYTVIQLRQNIHCQNVPQEKALE